MRGAHPKDRRSKRRCSRCHKWKRRSLKNFKPSERCREGLTGICRVCSAAYHRAWKKKNRVRLLKERRARYASSEKIKMARRTRARWRRDPRRMRAQLLRSGVKIRSSAKGLRVDKALLTTKYWAERLINQPACECCGREFRLVVGNGVPSDASPSVDQIRPKGGYTEKNTALLCWRCNNLKRDATPEELLGVANWMKMKLQGGDDVVA